MLKALVAEGMVSRDDRARRYRLGTLVFELGLVAAPQFNLRELCAASLQRLAEATGDTAFPVPSAAATTRYASAACKAITPSRRPSSPWAAASRWA